MSMEGSSGTLVVFISRRASPEAYSELQPIGRIDGYGVQVVDVDTQRDEAIAAGARVVPCACIREEGGHTVWFNGEFSAKAARAMLRRRGAPPRGGCIVM